MGKPCIKCGGAERNKWNQCVRCLRARYQNHKVEVYAQSKAWGEANPDKKEETAERSRLKKYGLTLEQHQALLAKQSGLCGVCKEPFGRVVHIDHDHVTGVVRGLLCRKCNVGLGYFRDNPHILRAAAAYLEVPQPTGLVARTYSPTYKMGDGRCKVTDAIRSEMQQLRAQGCSFGAIGKKLGLSRSWVYLTLTAMQH